MKLAPESLAALRESAEMLGAVCDRAAQCDHLEARNKHLQERNDSISARYGVLQAGIRKAREGLANAMPRCKGMGLPELVVEAVSEIQRLRAAHPAFGMAAATVEGLQGELLDQDNLLVELAELRSELEDVSDSRQMFLMELDALRLALRDARAENGRQAAVISALRAGGRQPDGSYLVRYDVYPFSHP